MCNILNNSEWDIARIYLDHDVTYGLGHIKILADHTILSKTDVLVLDELIESHYPLSSWYKDMKAGFNIFKIQNIYLKRLFDWEE